MNQVQYSVLYPSSKVRPRVQRLSKRIRKGKICRQEAQKLMHGALSVTHIKIIDQMRIISFWNTQ